ncbi:MAG: type I-U CRISPR-associated protein Csx17 [Proteobacteria bacterium]|nr:type I-U CRISPR-associated protein Csx17 [Pseudomonadota bacterium]
MTLHLHHLAGCTPAPLAYYLKALGILRVLAEQTPDSQARGWWQDEHFCLLSTLERAELERFLLTGYAPTAFVSPWNKGSGFYRQDDPALDPIERSTAARFAPFRAGIAAARGPLAQIAAADAAIRQLKTTTKVKKGMSDAEKRTARARESDLEHKRELALAEKNFKALKAELFTPFLRSWRGPHRRWLDAAMVLLDDGRAAWPSLLGTGGCDGRLDFTNNAMQRLGDLFDLAAPDGRCKPAATELLAHSLWDTPTDGLLCGAAIGQFLPGGAGGANSSSGPGGDSLVNPWDFILMLEGALLFSARSTRRLDPFATSRASAPFAVRAHAAGHGTRGHEKADRGEQWMPLWSNPTSLADLEAMIGEARLQLGRQVAHRPIDVARALSRLGATRGITAFNRFGYLERNGQSKIAVPLGRLGVYSRPRAHLIDDLAPWIDRLQRLARDQHAPRRLVLAEGGLADAVFAALTHDDAPPRWQAVLLAAGSVEALQASGTAFKAGPLPPLAPEWIVAADDGTVEWRLACALGSAAASYDATRRPHDPVRHHWLPLQPGGRRFLEQDKHLRRDSRVVMMGRDPVADFGALVQRRVIEAAQHGQRRLPLVSARGCDAHPADLAALLAGEVDLERVSILARSLMAVRWERCASAPCAQARRDPWPDEAWIAVRLCCLPWPLETQRSIPVDEGTIRRLLAGDAAGAVALALRRLRSAGLRPPLRAAFADAATAKRWAAALAFPVSQRCARAMAQRFDPQQHKELT